MKEYSSSKILDLANDRKIPGILRDQLRVRLEEDPIVAAQKCKSPLLLVKGVLALQACAMLLVPSIFGFNAPKMEVFVLGVVTPSIALCFVFGVVGFLREREFRKHIGRAFATFCELMSYNLEDENNSFPETKDKLRVVVDERLKDLARKAKMAENKYRLENSSTNKREWDEAEVSFALLFELAWVNWFQLLPLSAKQKNYFHKAEHSAEEGQKS